MDVTIDEILNTKLDNFKARYKQPLAPLLTCDQLKAFDAFTVNELRMYLCHPFARVVVSSLRQAVDKVEEREGTITTLGMALGVDPGAVTHCYNSLPLVSDGSQCASQTQLWQYVQFFLKYTGCTE